jgi:hypothetical protein
MASQVTVPLWPTAIPLLVLGVFLVASGSLAVEVYQKYTGPVERQSSVVTGNYGYQCFLLAVGVAAIVAAIILFGIKYGAVGGKVGGLTVQGGRMSYIA